MGVLNVSTHFSMHNLHFLTRNNSEPTQYIIYTIWHEVQDL
jgi:hypothetical protein